MQFPKLIKNTPKIRVLAVILFVFLSFLTPSSLIAQKKYVVVLDAGHGGKDPGNLGNGYKEKKIALKVVLAVGKELAKSKDIKVVYTRKTDVFVELHKRARIANSKKADLFVSIHCDSYTNPKVHGAGTFVLGLTGNHGNMEIAKRENAVILLEDNYKQNYDYDPNSPESVIGLSLLQEENLDSSLGLAGLIQTNFTSVRRYDRSVKQANFLVLRETVMPSVLIELGFLTNKAEGKFLDTYAGQIKMAKSIVKAIKKYVAQLKLNTIKPQSEKEQGIVEKPKKKEIKKIPAIKEVSNVKAFVDSKEKRKIIEVVVKPVNKNKPLQKETKKEPIKKQQPTKIKQKEVVTEKVTPKEEETPEGILDEILSEEPNEEKLAPSGTIEFKVQIAASRKFLSDDDFSFEGLKTVETMFIDDYYKYYYGNSPDFQEIKRVLMKVRNLGYKDAFVVAFKNGQKIPLQEALRKR